MRNPLQILIDKEKLTLDGIQQFYVNVDTELWKLETLCDLYGVISVSQTMIYVNTVNKAEDLKKKLEQKDFKVSIIHSHMSQIERSNIMKEFKGGQTRILVSTDLLSRGIDIQQVSIVINYDLPRDRECYLHRIGRSGRFGRKGVAINFITNTEEHYLKDLEQYYNTTIGALPETIQQYLT